MHEELVLAIYANNPRNVTHKIGARRVIVSAPDYSSHSAVFDTAFRYAEANGYTYKGSGHRYGETYTVTFTKRVTK